MEMNSMHSSPLDKATLDKAFDARFPKEIKNKLENAYVAIAGLGGLGSNIALMLARSGVGHLLLIDFDVVDVTNLNRQAYLIPQIGMPKTQALKELLYQINPYLDYKEKQVKVTPQNIGELFVGYPLVCEAFDNPEQKAMLVQGILTTYPNTVIVSGNGMAGYGESNDIVTKQIMKRVYVCGDTKTDIAEGLGLMSPRVTICAAHQANKIIQLIMGH